MADSGNRSANFIVDVEGSVTRLNMGLSNTKQLMSSIKSMSGGVAQNMGGGAVASSNQVAPNPVFHAPNISYGNEYAESSLVAQNPTSFSYGGGGGGGYNPSYPGGSYGYYGGGPGGPGGSSVISSGGSKGGNNLTSYIQQNPLAATLYAGQAVSNAFFSTSEMVQSQLLMQRASFYTGGAKSYNDINDQQAKLLGAGSSISNMDAMNALVAAQSNGLAGAQNFLNGSKSNPTSLMENVAAASNLTPGMGLEGTLRATGSMQMGSSVNMLKGIGIQLRGTDGSMKGPGQVIDELWTLICKDYKQAYGGAGTPTLKDVQIGLQPGNSLDSMLNQYFGNDPMLKQMVTNGLMFKAQSGGGADAASISTLTSSAAAEAAGLTTSGMTSFANRNAASGASLGTVASAGAAGYGDAADKITNITNLFASLNGALEKTPAYLKAFTDTLLGAGNGLISGLLGDFTKLGGFSALQGLLSGVTAKASGGPVTGATTYLVGEKGPELFTPSVSGNITPNNQLSNVSGGGNNITMNINVPNANTPEVIKALKDLMNNVNSIQRASQG